MKRVLVTGATGFVGSALCEVLAQGGYQVRAALRTARTVPASISESAVVGDVTVTTDWSSALRDVDAIVHLAARAHILNDEPANSDQYFETNARGTVRLARAAAEAGVRRFVFLSSIKVNGEETSGSAYTPFDEPLPRGAYGRSKWLAEKQITETAVRAGMEVSIVRAPLVYGPGVRANFLRLMRWVDKGRPLPLGAVHNRRSLVSVGNLCDLLTLLLTHPAAPGRTWMVSDGEDLSTPDLIKRLASAMGRRARLIPVPVSLLHLAGVVSGRRAEMKRLCGSLAVDITQTRTLLDWKPPMTVDDGISRTVSWFLSEGRLRVS